MLMRQVSDRKRFLDTAREKNAVIVVVRSTTILPKIEGTRVHMIPALALQYSFRFTERGSENCWVYREEKPDLEERADFTGTLWEELEKLREGPDAKVKVKLHHRTGSF